MLPLVSTCLLPFSASRPLCSRAPQLRVSPSRGNAKLPASSYLLLLLFLLRSLPLNVSPSFPLPSRQRFASPRFPVLACLVLSLSLFNSCFLSSSFSRLSCFLLSGCVFCFPLCSFFLPSIARRLFSRYVSYDSLLLFFSLTFFILFIHFPLLLFPFPHPFAFLLLSTAAAS